MIYVIESGQVFFIFMEYIWVVPLWSKGKPLLEEICKQHFNNLDARQPSGHLITWLMMIGSGGIRSACSRCGISENFIRCVSKICRTKGKRKKNHPKSLWWCEDVKHFNFLWRINKASIIKCAEIQSLGHRVLNLLNIHSRPLSSVVLGFSCWGSLRKRLFFPLLHKAKCYIFQ